MNVGHVCWWDWRSLELDVKQKKEHCVQHRDQPMDVSVSWSRDRKMSLCRYWVWSSIEDRPSSESGTTGSPALCIGQDVIWQ